MARRRCWPGWCCAVVLIAGAAAAHDADVIYVALEQPAGQPLVEVVTLTTPSLLRLAPIDFDGDEQLDAAELAQGAAALRLGVWAQVPLSAGGHACARSGEVAQLRDGYVELGARFACGAGELRQDFRVLEVLPPNYRVVLGRQLEGERGRQFAQGRLTSLSVPRPQPAAALTFAALREGLGLAPRWLLRWEVAGLWLLLAAALARGARVWPAVAVAVVGVVGAAAWRVGSPWGVVVAVPLIALAPARLATLAAAIGGVALGVGVGEPRLGVALGVGLGAAAGTAVAAAALAPLARLAQRRPPGAWLLGGAGIVLVVVGAALR